LALARREKILHRFARMGFFKPSAQLGRCEQCRAIFDPVYGGACVRCGRLLCAPHLHGGVWRQLVARLVPRPSTVCVSCRLNDGSAARRD
jgi:hypothetical protein